MKSTFWITPLTNIKDSTVVLKINDEKNKYKFYI